MKTIKVMLLLVTLISSCSSDSQIKREANAKAQEWWDASVAICEGKLYTKVMHDKIIVGGNFPFVTDKPLIEFKKVKFLLLEEKLTNADILNGLEWKGYAAFPINFIFRYYDYDDKKWSSWRESTMIYERNKFEKSFDDFLGKKFNTPLVQELIKENGKWNYDRDQNNLALLKPACSEIPKD